MLPTSEVYLFSRIFHNKLTLIQGIFFLLIISFFIFNALSDLPEKLPLLGIFTYSLVPFLFVAGGAVFLLFVFRSRSREKQSSLNRENILFLSITGAISLVLLIMGGYQLYDFSESNDFCGRLCHVLMRPEYVTYQESPHSRVACVDCHVGPGASYLVKSKIRGMPQILSVISKSYDRPITTPIDNLRPARDTCEQCHRPEIIAGDLLRTFTTFDSNETNTKHSINMVLRIGTGQEQIAEDIHWHVAGPVWYLPVDQQRNQIAWVSVEKGGSGTAEFINPELVGEITPERIEEEKRLMDCIDCHNRPAHIFYSPEQLIDSAMADGRIDDNLPYIKREALEATEPPSRTLEEAFTRVEAIADFYQTTYPAIYQEQQISINAAIDQLKNVALLTVFPEMEVNWQTHQDNIGHSRSPGCFRCHGKLTTSLESEETEYLSDDCNLCHYNPGPEGPLQQATLIPHSTAGLEDCLSCHDSTGIKPFPADHVGRSNVLCSACHQQSDVFVPLVTALPESPLIPHTTDGLQDCFSCHGPSAVRPFPADHVGRTNELCMVCHSQSEGIVSAPVSPPEGPQILHSIAGMDDCYTCHGPSSIRPYPANHVGRSNTLCTICHKPPQVTAPLPATPPSAIPIPHSTSGLENCTLCHGPGSVVPYPADHVGRTNTLCIICHSRSSTSLPPSEPPPASNIPHTIVGRSDCLQCHSQSGIIPFPSDHTGRTNSQCTICHTPLQ